MRYIPTLPAGDDRKLGEIDLISLKNDFLTCRLTRFGAWRELPELEEARNHRQLAHQPFGHLEIEHARDPVADLIERVDTERERDSLHRAEEIDRHRKLRARAAVENHILEEERVAAARTLHHAIGYLANLQLRLYRLRNALELSDSVNRGNEIADAVETHAARSPT